MRVKPTAAVASPERSSSGSTATRARPVIGTPERSIGLDEAQLPASPAAATSATSMPRVRIPRAPTSERPLAQAADQLDACVLREAPQRARARAAHQRDAVGAAPRDRAAPHHVAGLDVHQLCVEAQHRELVLPVALQL